MKKIVVLLLLLTITTHTIAVPESDSPLAENNYEGFLAGTLVSTPHGLVAIENLTVGDTVTTYAPNGPCTAQPIISVTTYPVETYITIEVDNEKIVAAPHQKFYVAEQEQWVNAQDLTSQQKLLTALAQCVVIRHVERINQPQSAYALTVNDHIVYVSPYLIRAHNASLAVDAGVVLKVGKLVCKHPVVVVLGELVDLANGCIVVHNALQALQKLVKNTAPQQAPFSQERFIYEYAQHELVTIKQELLSTLTSLRSLKQLYGSDSTDFTYNFLQPDLHHTISNPLCAISAAEEAQYSWQQKEQLQNARQADLDALEEQIVHLQISLGMHLHFLIEQRNQLLASTTVELAAVCNLAKVKELQPNNFAKDKARLLYEKVITAEELLNLLASKNHELKLICCYYKVPSNAAIIKKSSNLMEIVVAQEQPIATVETIVQTQKIALVDYKKAAEQHLIKINCPIPHSNNKSHPKNYNAQSLAAAQQQRAAIQPPHNPKKNNNKKDDDTNKHPHGIYEDAAYHHQNSGGRKSPSPKNGQKALDNSVPCPKDENEPLNFRHRIAACDEEIVVLRQTSEGKFHGYVCPWEDLESHMQRALRRHNLVSKKGKFL